MFSLVKTMFGVETADTFTQIVGRHAYNIEHRVVCLGD
jgi:hypothetical protein